MGAEKMKKETPQEMEDRIDEWMNKFEQSKEFEEWEKFADEEEEKYGY